MINIGKICNRNVTYIDETADIHKVAELMSQSHVDAIVVIETRNDIKKPIGLVTDRDIIVKVLAKEISHENFKINDIMSREMICFRENEEVMDTLRIMSMEGVRRVPVVSKEGDLVGILSIEDLFELLADEFSNLVMLFCRQQRYEKESAANN
jgi:CBS domain-containing protein